MHGRYTKSNHLFPGFEYFTDLKVLSLTEVDIAMGWKPNTAEIGLFWMRLSCLRISRYLIQTMCLEEEGKKTSLSSFGWAFLVLEQSFFFEVVSFSTFQHNLYIPNFLTF